MRLSEVMNDAYDFANCMFSTKLSKEPCSAEHLSVFDSKSQKIFIENLIAGAIFAYHEALQKELAEQGVFIPEIEA